MSEGTKNAFIEYFKVLLESEKQLNELRNQIRKEGLNLKDEFIKCSSDNKGVIDAEDVIISV